MFPYIFLWIGITASFFAGGYHLDYQITYPHKRFRTIKLKGNLSKFFMFKNKSRVLKVALLSQIVGYLILMAGFIFNFYILYLTPAERTRYQLKYIYFMLGIGVLGGIYEIICYGIYSFSNSKNNDY